MTVDQPAVSHLGCRWGGQQYSISGRRGVAAAALPDAAAGHRAVCGGRNAQSTVPYISRNDHYLPKSQYPSPFAQRKTKIRLDTKN